VPQVAKIAAVRLQFGAIDYPGDLGGLLGLGLGPVALLRGAFLGEVRGHATEWAGRYDATATGFHPSTVPAAILFFA